MGTMRRLFTDEFKREAVELLASGGRPLIQAVGSLIVNLYVLKSAEKFRGRRGGEDLDLMPLWLKR